MASPTVTFPSSSTVALYTVNATASGVAVVASSALAVTVMPANTVITIATETINDNSFFLIFYLQ